MRRRFPRVARAAAGPWRDRRTARRRRAACGRRRAEPTDDLGAPSPPRGPSPPPRAPQVSRRLRPRLVPGPMRIRAPPYSADIRRYRLRPPLQFGDHVACFAFLDDGVHSDPLVVAQRRDGRAAAARATREYFCRSLCGRSASGRRDPAASMAPCSISAMFSIFCASTGPATPAGWR